MCVAGWSARGQSGVSLSPVSGADGVFETVVLNGTTVYRSTGTPGSYALYMYFRCPASVRNQTVYLEVTYLDAGLGYFGTQYNSTSSSYQPSTVQYQNYCQQSNRIVTAVFQLTAADFRQSQNLGADLRLESDPSLQKQIISATIYFVPTPTFLKFQPDWMGPYKGRTYGGDNLVDATTLNGKVICGYQGWFRTPADPTGLSWQHYFRSTLNDVAVDLWPDMSEYSLDEQYVVPGWQLNSGKQAYLFSSANKRTVLRHFQWMEAYGLECAEVQRFIASVGTVGDPESYRVLCYAREAANRTGRTFFVEYDLSGFAPSVAIPIIRQDWKFMVDSLKLTADRRYQFHNGQPVVGIFGFFTDRFSSSAADSILQIFRGSGPYSAFVEGSGQWPWRTDPSPGWAAVYRKMPAYAPWNIGNYVGGAASADASTSTWLPDKQALDSVGGLYVPVIYPGFSWDNLKNQAPGTTNHPRRYGAFLWNQFLAAKQIGAAAVFVAMFDEIDEGTAIFKTANDVPLNHYFLPLEPGLPSDFYLSLTGYGARIIKGTVSPPGSMPDFTQQSQPPIPDILSPAFGDTVLNQLTISWTRVTHSSGITGYEVELDRVISSVPDTSSMRILSDGNHRVRVRAVNGLGMKGGWSEVQNFVTVVSAPLAPTLAAPADSARNVQLNTTLTWSAAATATMYHLQLSTLSDYSATLLNDSLLTATSRAIGPLSLATTYYWRVRAKNDGGYGAFSTSRQFTTIRTTSIEQLGSGIPKEFALAQNYPNPFNPTTTISFSLPSKSFVLLKVFDIMGKEVATLVNEEMSAGSYSQLWNAVSMSSGIYFYRLQAGSLTEIKKLILFK
jgi:hypothetical protein